MSERVIHACNWSLNYVESNLKLIKDQGFTAIQLSPMQDHKKEVNGGKGTNQLILK